MEIIKVINNNIVSSVQDGREVVVMGRGIGFQKKPGTVIADNQIEKVFVMDNHSAANRLTKMLAQIPIEHIETTDKIVSFAQKYLGKELSDNIYIQLSDHISYAISRIQKGKKVQNALLWEIKTFYPREYYIGSQSLKIIEEELGTQLPEDEAGFIAIHIVNANMESEGVENVYRITKFIQNVLQIIRYHYKLEPDETTMQYERMITHLKFLGNRILKGTPLESRDEEFYQMLCEKYPPALEGTNRIAELVMKEFQYQMSKEERAYLTVHIERIINDVSE